MCTTYSSWYGESWHMYQFSITSPGFFMYNVLYFMSSHILKALNYGCSVYLEKYHLF